MLNYTSTADRYTVSGSSYTINFPYWKEAEVKAVITLTDGTMQDLVLDTDYSVSTPNGNNGTLTKLTAWTDANKLTIYRDSAKTQDVDLVQGQKINADTIENALDHAIAINQELQEKLSRSITTSIDEAGSDIQIPDKATRAGMILGFDNSGENAALRSLAQFDIDVANTAANATAAANSATLANKWAENPVDTPVELGNYSAKHWASKASTSAGSASVSAYNADQSAEDSEAWAVGKRSGSDVPATDPAYHNNSKYYLDLVKQTISGALRYQGVWTTTGATDYSGISLPRLKGDMYYCQGSACTIDGVTYSQGDYIIFNQDVSSGTITTSMIDKVDNTETVTPDNTCTLENKTIPLGDNDITTTADKVIVSDADGNIGAGSVDASKIVSTDGTQTLTNKTIAYADNTLTGVQPTLTAGTGIDITGTTISAKQTYSTSEVKTGDVWIDGKPIYRKTHVTTTFSKTTGTYRSLYTSAGTKVYDVDTVVKMEASFKVDFNGSTRSIVLGTVDIIDVTTTGITYSSVLTYRHDNGDFFGTLYTKGTFIGDVYQMVATLYYTKTTD